MTDSTPPTLNRRLIAILLLALVLRLGVMIATIFSHDDLGVFHQPDTHTYVTGAEQMLFEHRYTNIIGQPEIRRTPGYPLFLIPGILLGHLELITVGLQILVSVATVWLVYRTASLLFDRSEVAQLCALLYAIEPLSITYCCYLLTETLFTFLLVLSVFELIVFLKHSKVRDLVFSALTLAAATYVRPTGFFIAPLLVGLLCLRCLAKPRQPARALKHALVFGAISMGVIGLWQVRNYAQTGYHRFSAISDHMIYFYHGASVTARLNGKTDEQQRTDLGYYDRHSETLYETAPELRDSGEAAQYYYMRAVGVEVITQNPVLFGKIYSTGLLRTSFAPGMAAMLGLFEPKLADFKATVRETVARRGIIVGFFDMSRRYPLAFLITVICVTITISYYLLSIIGVLSQRAMLFNMPMAVVFSVSLYLVLVAGGIVAGGRYRISAMPMVCMVAGLGLSAVISRVSRFRQMESEQPITTDLDSKRILKAA